MIELLRREAVYLWYYFSIQLEQIFKYWVLGMVLGSLVSVFLKEQFDATEEFVTAVEEKPVLEGWGNKIIQISQP